MKKITRAVFASAILLAMGVSASSGLIKNSVKAQAETATTITVTQADNGKTFSVDNAKITEYYEKYSVGCSEKYYGSDEYLTDAVTLTWQEKGAYHQVYVSDEKHFVNAEKHLTATNSLTLDNLVPNRKYYWKVKTASADGTQTFSDVYTFTPTAYTRTMNIDGVENMRDLGGLKTSDGKTIQYGIIYRSANLDSITAKGKNQIKKLGIKTDIDLRGSSSTVSPIGNDVKRLNFNAPYYVDETDANGEQSGLNGSAAYVSEFAAAVKACAVPENYPLDFHCAIGRDRTGTLAAMLYAICGVSEADIIREYELSWFSSYAANNPYIKVSAITKLCNYINGLNGTDFGDKARNYVLSTGVTQNEINSIRDILTGKTQVADDFSVPASSSEPADEPDLPVFADGNFGYLGEKTSINVYEGSQIENLTESEAAAAGVPEGYSGNVLKITPSDGAQYPYQFDAVIDFSTQKIKRTKIEGISVRAYVVSTEKDNTKHPEIRIPTHDKNDWILRKNVSATTDQWITFDLSSSDIDALCSYGNGYLTKFVLALRSEKQTTMYIDHVIVTKTSGTDNEPPVITVPCETIKTTNGTYADNLFTVTDDSGNADFSTKWSNGALDRRGRLTEGTHTCVVTATDSSDNVAEKTVTFNVEKEPEITLYKITFKGFESSVEVLYAEGDTVTELIPDVPYRKYYEGAWADFTLEKTQNQVVNAVYTPIVYTVTFKADGQTIATATYTVEDTEITEPEVPQKEGFTAKWSNYNLTGGDKIVNAVYEAVSDPEPKPDPDSSSSTGGSSSTDNSSVKPVSGGCKSAIGTSIGLPCLLLALAAITRKRR